MLQQLKDRTENAELSNPGVGVNTRLPPRTGEAFDPVKNRHRPDYYHAGFHNTRGDAVFHDPRHEAASKLQ
jgi:hypothetical protein